MMTKGFSLAIAVLIVGQGLIPSIASAQAKKPAPPKSASAEAAEDDAEVSYAPIGSAVAKDNINVRGQASFNGEVLAKLRKGDSVTILEEITRKKPAKDEPTNWFRISLPSGTPVWVFADYLNAETKAVKSKRLNFRGGPGENYSVLGRLNKGDAVKSVTTKGAWMQIETPPNASAFVAADLFEKQGTTAAPTAEPTLPSPAPVEPAPAPEVVTVPEPVTPAQPVAAEPTPAPVVEQPAPAIASDAPAPALVSPPPAPAAETFVKRIVKREGTVSRAHNIQAPSYFEMEGWDSGKVINYLHSPEEQVMDEKSKKTKSIPKIDLELYVGRRVIVTGEELIDKRWRSTPVIEVEAIELEQ